MFCCSSPLRVTCISIISTPFCKGASINYVDKQGRGRGSPKCQRYYIRLFSKFVNEGGGRDQKSSKICQHSLWMSPKPMTSIQPHKNLKHLAFAKTPLYQWSYQETGTTFLDYFKNFWKLLFNPYLNSESTFLDTIKCNLKSAKIHCLFQHVC